MGLGTKAVRLSLLGEEERERGCKGDKAERLLEVLDGGLDFSFSHEGVSLEGVGVGVIMLDLMGSGCKVNLDTGVFWFKSLRSVLVFEGDSNLAQFR